MSGEPGEAADALRRRAQVLHELPPVLPASVVMADEGELQAYLDIAVQADNKDLARAVFVAAERRGSGDLMTRYFDEVDPEARELYQEFASVPPAEVLERQRENVQTVLPQPDALSLETPAQVNF